MSLYFSYVAIKCNIKIQRKVAQLFTTLLLKVSSQHAFYNILCKQKIWYKLLDENADSYYFYSLSVNYKLTLNNVIATYYKDETF